MNNLNLIHRQADDFLRNAQRVTRYNYKDFIQEVRNALLDYNKITYKIQFIERIKYRFKMDYDKHLDKCDMKVKSNCIENQIFENLLFFLKEKLEELESEVDDKDFDLSNRNNMNQTLNEILIKLNKLNIGQEVIFEELSDEFAELKSFYFLNKKNWVELFMGKLTNMTGGIISATISKEIVSVIKESYPNLIQ